MPGHSTLDPWDLARGVRRQCKRHQGKIRAHLVCQVPPMPAQPLRAAEAAASSLLAAVESHSPDAVQKIRQHLIPAVAHFSVWALSI